MRRTVLVTGASSGIGLATVRHLVELGFHCVGTVRSEDDLDVLADATATDRVVGEVMDVTDERACERVVADHTLYAVVNNAGYFNAGLVEDVDDEAARAQLEAMVVAPARLARLALPQMRQRGQGRIVNVTSAMVDVHFAMTGWYQASKAALDALTDALRAEVAADGVDVVAVEPAAIDTQIWHRAEEDLRRRRVGAHRPAAYDRGIAFIRALHGHMHSPDAVAQAIGAALVAGRPRARYRVGVEGPVLRWASRLAPALLRDRVLQTVLRLDEEPSWRSTAA